VLEDLIFEVPSAPETAEPGAGAARDGEEPRPARASGAEAGESADVDERELDRLLASAELVERKPEARGPGALPVPSYSLEDLPPVPGRRPRTEPGEEGEFTGDRLAEQALPDLAFSPGEDLLEEAAQRTPLVPDAETGARGIMSDAQFPPAPLPLPQEVVGARRAADMSTRELVAVERLLEGDLRPTEYEAPIGGLVALEEPRKPRLTERLRSMLSAAGESLSELRGSLDRRLAPYALNCKTLLGIVGILTLCLIGAMSYRVWVLGIY
jgi:hypothetical protein